MKRHSRLMLAILSVPLAASLWLVMRGYAPPAWTRFDSAELGLSFSYPSQWQVSVVQPHDYDPPNFIGALNLVSRNRIMLAIMSEQLRAPAITPGDVATTTVVDGLPASVSISSHPQPIEFVRIVSGDHLITIWFPVPAATVKRKVMTPAPYVEVLRSLEFKTPHDGDS